MRNCHSMTLVPTALIYQACLWPVVRLTSGPEHRLGT